MAVRMPAKRRRQRRVQRRGFTLAEVIVGAIILGIGLAAVVSVSSRAMMNHTRGERMIVASWLADELLAMVLVEGPQAYLTRRNLEGAFEEPFEEYTYTMEIEYFSDVEPYRVTAVVGWPPYDDSSLVEIQTWMAARQTWDDEELPERAPEEPIDRMRRYYDDEW